ncbi:MAG: transglutaminase domain-containing protein, partial [Eubacteriales bacterium]|nr:transglutaminase domain-containing protein [Eubacteriales bacterium]
DYNGEYTSLPEYESIMEHQKGVCAHYASLEARLLNKLGIFALEVGGYTEPGNMDFSGHVWDILWLNGKWYSVDPTWLDEASAIKALQEGYAESLNYYMRNINDADFNALHYLDFTSYNLIPEKERVSHMSILSSFAPDGNIEDNDSSVPSIPNTGFFSNSDGGAQIINVFLVAITGTAVTAFLVHYICYRIYRYLKVNHF